ncbi:MULTISPECIES: NUDIX hydrolase [unclassified Streptomyces]|uniref:NUDIX hydrolase n=1 Tax=unclassified Streptomyces TaxID=2593676 RepID=UPI002E12D240|nr:MULTISPECIES: NUDIX hydrolase [unclassified Streptomyces]WSR29060.1 NUDIX hydrolase [Streptomyces sp. NBC_01205]
MTTSAGRTRATASAAVIVRDEQGRVLIVNPVYKERWNLPGGHLEEGELPTAAARREVREEIGLDLEIGDLLVSAWVTRAEGSHVFYVFDGPQLSPEQQRAITLQESEIGEIRFCLPEDIPPSMIPPFALGIWRKALAAREDKRAAYLEFAL